MSGDMRAIIPDTALRYSLLGYVHIIDATDTAGYMVPADRVEEVLAKLRDSDPRSGWHVKGMDDGHTVYAAMMPRPQCR